MTIAPKAAGLDRSYEDQFVVPPPPRGKYPPVGLAVDEAIAAARSARTMPAVPDPPSACKGPACHTPPVRYRME